MAISIPKTFWIDRLDVAVKIARDEEAQVGIAGVTSRPAVSSGKLDDEVRGNFSPADIGQIQAFRV